MLVRNVSLETSWLTAALLGSVALGAALAFGIGGREVAGQLLSQAYDKGQQNKDQVKQDMQTGKAHGQQQANQPRTRLRRGLMTTWNAHALLPQRAFA